ncbi:NUDIX hydrolase [Deltaproteobacteria bacterium TL4]
MQTKPSWYYEQSAVIPYRLNGEEIEILMITSRKKKRWVIPKGIVETQMSPEESAAKEALEEAGVEGQVEPNAIGEYFYEKWGGICRVQVFLLEITMMYSNWMEADFRERRWVSVTEACELIREETLKDIILNAF